MSDRREYLFDHIFLPTPAPSMRERQIESIRQAMSVTMRNIRAFSTLLLSLTFMCSPVLAKKQNQGPNLIRDAEIEGLLRMYSKPIFKAAGINPDAVRVYVIADPSINAFVAGGQRIFINTGLITRAKTPSQVIGVLAHETGHIAGGHLAKMQNEMQSASAERIVGMLLGAAAMVGGTMAGSSETAQAGQGIIMGSAGAAQRGFLSYQRGMESTADQSALKYLKATHQSPKGMLDLFQVLANESLASTHGTDSYAYSHPMAADRIRALEVAAIASPDFDKPDDAGLMLRHQLAQAKLVGFMESPQQVYVKYPSSNKSLPARYARAIAMFRRGDLKNAMPVIDSLTAEMPEDPYFWELKAQAYLENGQPEKGIPPIKKARSLLPNNGLLQILAAQILLGNETAVHADEALSILRKAKQTEPDTPEIYKNMAKAYALKEDLPRAELATAEFAWLTGDAKLAIEKATSSQLLFKRGSPEWLRAADILNFANRKKR
jgi:predicted Zn-dependent protease